MDFCTGEGAAEDGREPQSVRWKSSRVGGTESATGIAGGAPTDVGTRTAVIDRRFTFLPPVFTVDRPRASVGRSKGSEKEGSHAARPSLRRVGGVKDDLHGGGSSARAEGNRPPFSRRTRCNSRHPEWPTPTRSGPAMILECTRRDDEAWLFRGVALFFFFTAV